MMTDSKHVFADLGLVQEVMDYKLTVSGIEFKLQPNVDEAVVLTEIEKSYPIPIRKLV
jgi:hypothetical protein